MEQTNNTKEELDKLYDSYAKLKKVSDESSKNYVNLLKKIKMDGRKDRVIRAVLDYPFPTSELIEKEDEKLAVAAGMVYMQTYTEIVALDTIISLLKASDSEAQNKESANE